MNCSRDCAEKQKPDLTWVDYKLLLHVKYICGAGSPNQ